MTADHLDVTFAALAGPLAEATEWLECYRQFWEGSFQRLDALLDEMKTRKKRERTSRSRT